MSPLQNVVALRFSGSHVLRIGHIGSTSGFRMAMGPGGQGFGPGRRRGGERGASAGGAACPCSPASAFPFTSDTIYSFMSFGKSIPPHNHQLNILISISKQ